MPALRQEYFNLLLHHKTSADAAMRRWDSLQVDMRPSGMVVMLVEIDDFAAKSKSIPVREAELIRFALQNIVEETLRSYTKGIITRETHNQFVVVMNTSESISAHSIAEQCRANIENHTKFSISIGMGLEAEGLDGISESYQQALKALTSHFNTGGNAVFQFSDLRVSESDELINKALAFIHSHLHLNLTIPLCAEHVHLSSSYFANLFKKVTGTTFIQYVTQERMKRAKVMLLENKQVQDISQTLGYEERRYFSDVFKKHTGMTPSEFRQAYIGASDE
jgi:YesN/AraC family two-component response regulator